MSKQYEDEERPEKKGCGFGLIVGTLLGAGLCYGGMKISDWRQNRATKELEDFEDDYYEVDPEEEE